MKRRLLGFLFVTALLLGVSTIVAACGGGEEELTLEEYFQRLEAIGDDVEARSEAFDVEFEKAFDPETSPETTIDILGTVFSQAASVSKEALNDVENLNPPSEAREAHDGFVQELRERVELFEDVADRAADAESQSGLEDVFAELEGREFETAAVRFADACRALEQVAADNDIEVDLNCE